MFLFFINPFEGVIWGLFGDIFGGYLGVFGGYFEGRNDQKTIKNNSKNFLVIF